MKAATIHGTASIPYIGNEKLGEGGLTLRDRCFVLGGDFVAFAGATGDADRCAIHVHFPVANSIEPSPSQSVITRIYSLGNRPLESARAVAAGVIGEIAIDVCGTATNNRVDNLPFRVFVWLSICSQRHLTRSTTVDGTASEAEGILLTDGEAVGFGRWSPGGSASIFAREVTSVGGERGAVEGICAVWMRRVHDHVTVGEREGRYKSDESG